MSPDLYLILAIILAGFGVTLILVRRWLAEKPQTDAALTEWLKSMQSTVQGSSSDVAKLLQENTRQLNDRLDNAARVISSVQKTWGKCQKWVKV